MIDAVMARKPAADHPPLPSPDYAFPAIPRLMADRIGDDDFHEMLDDSPTQQPPTAATSIEQMLNRASIRARSASR